jgi:hypothetical protein
VKEKDKIKKKKKKEKRGGGGGGGLLVWSSCITYRESMTS